MKKRDRIINLLREQSDNMAGKMSELSSFEVDDIKAIVNNQLISHMVDQIYVFSKSTHREKLLLRSEVFLKEQELEKLARFHKERRKR